MQTWLIILIILFSIILIGIIFIRTTFGKHLLINSSWLKPILLKVDYKKNNFICFYSVSIKWNSNYKIIDGIIFGDKFIFILIDVNTNKNFESAKTKGNISKKIVKNAIGGAIPIKILYVQNSKKNYIDNKEILIINNDVNLIEKIEYIEKISDHVELALSEKKKILNKLVKVLVKNQIGDK